MVVCCSSRDELDSVCSAVSNLHYISLASLYSDLAEADRSLILEKFRQTTSRWSQKFSSLSEEKCEAEKVGEKSHMIVVTDACLPLLASGESPLSAHVLINYEIPTKKETYMRRMTTCSASDGILINMVVGGEVVTLKSIEESSGLVIAEMPINVPKCCSGAINPRIVLKAACSGVCGEKVYQMNDGLLGYVQEQVRSEGTVPSDEPKTVLFQRLRRIIQ
ncbi:ATP-dependent RNA helicase eIF4A isoform X2 [Cucumis sativus]|nr:ATP-dependent RNA helicase eIF4A isoform X2 [Cucumis sativus]